MLLGNAKRGNGSRSEKRGENVIVATITGFDLKSS